MVFLDTFGNRDDTTEELCCALRATQGEDCQFKICVRRLDLATMPIEPIVEILEQVDPEVGLVIYSLMCMA